MKKFKKSQLLPPILLVYLAFMAYLGRNLFYEGQYLYYFSVLGISLVVIVLLYFSLRRKERLKEQKEQDKQKDLNK